MTCCAPGVEAGAELSAARRPELDDQALLEAAHPLKDGLCQLELAVPDVHCATCMTTIERALNKLEMVENARVNLSTKRVRIVFTPGKVAHPSDITRAIIGAGYRTFLLDAESDLGDDTLKSLVRALAVSGFAAGNIMLFSVSIWSGADAATRDLFHWISALIAIPAIAYAGQVFFKSAWRALRRGTTNMDVPISLAIVTAPAMSVIETFNHGTHAYFDAAVSLLFFLLIGRTLDHMMRERARGAVRNLARLAPRGATRVQTDGNREYISLPEIRPGMVLEITAGERVPVDAEVLSGTGQVDLALVTGESVPETAVPGSKLLAGATNLSGVMQVRADRPASQSFLSRMIELMAAAEDAKAGYKRIADRAARLYAPVVHVLAAATLLFWGLSSGDWHLAATNAIAVLIITCPCALALAVPIVHVVAAGRLFEAGIMMRDGAALERAGEVSRVVFDKTGTLTAGRPDYLGTVFGTVAMLGQAARLAAASKHPFSQALVRAAGGARPVSGEVREEPGRGVEAQDGGHVWRLGKADWCGAGKHAGIGTSTVWLSRDGEPVAGFAFADRLRSEAPAAVDALRSLGLELTLLSGDREEPVKAVAGTLRIDGYAAGLAPEDKVARINRFRENGERVLMVGDGINDAPALRAAHASMAPSSAADIGRNAADFVFTRDSLDAVPLTIRVARRAGRLVKENFALAIAYNLVAVPLAVTGHVTPLIAAVAMSSSSILVTLNALTLRLGERRGTRPPLAAGTRMEVAE